MSWQTEIPIIVRTLINDWSDQPVYSDERIIQVITVAAKYVQFDVSLDHQYQIDVGNLTLEPDPTTNKDEIFVSLVSLKSACLIDQSNLRTKAAIEGIRAALGPASLSVGGSLEGIRMVLEHGPCALYEELTSHWDVKDATAIRAILSPFVGNNFNPRYIQSYGYRARDFYS
jgi:hypothetical protein